MVSTAAQWRAALEAWALPDRILEAAPEDPYRTPVGVLSQPERWTSEHPTIRPIEAHLPPGGVLVDVGCGPGTLAARYVGDARVVGVEPAPHLAAQAAASGIEVVEERWPDAAPRVPEADVVVCTHVLYDVADLTPFVAALTHHARGVVVVELTARHPWAGLAPLYRRFHDLDRPDGPTADQAIAVVVDAVGAAAAVERWLRPGTIYEDLDALVAHRRRQLCLPAEADPEVAEAIAGTYEVLDDGRVQTRPGEVVTLRWEGRAEGGSGRASGWAGA